MWDEGGVGHAGLVFSEERPPTVYAEQNKVCSAKQGWPGLSQTAPVTRKVLRALRVLKVFYEYLQDVCHIHEIRGPRFSSLIIVAQMCLRSSHDPLYKPTTGVTPRVWWK